MSLQCFHTPQVRQVSEWIIGKYKSLSKYNTKVNNYLRENNKYWAAPTYKIRITHSGIMVSCQVYLKIDTKSDIKAYQVVLGLEFETKTGSTICLFVIWSFY